MKKVLLTLGLAVWLLAACSLGAPPAPTIDVNAANTLVAQTVEAQRTSDQAAIETIVAATSIAEGVAPPPADGGEAPATASEVPTETAGPTETPTETLTPTDEPTPTLSASDPKSELGSPNWTDNFSNSNNWFGYDQGDSKVEVSGGVLSFTVKPAPSGTLWTVAQPSLNNFYIEVVGKTPAACSSKDRFGLLLRAPDPSRGMIFEFSCDGFYRIAKWDGAVWTELAAWSASGNILSGPDQSNRMGVKAVGNTYQLYANGVLLAEVMDGQYGSGRFGLVAGSEVTNNFTVDFDDMAYWVLP